MRYIITESEKPPTGLYGGSSHDYERGIDPFSRECMPKEFHNQLPDVPPVHGWLALDWCGNVIGFLPDGTELKIESERAITTRHDPPPIPDRNHDWTAVREGYDQGDPVGHGLTEEAAIADLKEQEPESPKPDEVRFADMTELVKEEKPTPPKPEDSNKELCQWLRDHSSGIYRKSACAADVIEGLESDLAAARRLLNDERTKISILETKCSLSQESEQRLRAALEAGRLAIGDHIAPNDCYSTGPLTGDPIRDFVCCPACAFIASYEAALAPASSGKGEG